MSNKEDLKILQKTYDMILYSHKAFLQYPKSEKHALASETRMKTWLILDLFLDANKKHHKKTTLQNADKELDKLRYAIRLGKDLGYLPFKKYEILSKQLNEIGRMLGGWIKTMNK